MFTFERGRSRAKLGEWIEAHKHDPDPLSILEELTVLRGYLALFLEKKGTGGLSYDEITSVRGLVVDIARVVSSIQRMREHNPFPCRASIVCALRWLEWWNP
jgi:hypothetical protein